MNFQRYRLVTLSLLQKYGKDKQVYKCIEELIELCHELIRYRAGKIDREAIIDELVDVFITTMQVAQIFDLNKVIQRLDKKIEEVERKHLMSH